MTKQSRSGTSVARISFTSPTVAELPDDATLVECWFVKRRGWVGQSVGVAKGTDGGKGGLTAGRHARLQAQDDQSEQSGQNSQRSAHERPSERLR